MARLEFDGVVEATPGSGGGAYVALPADTADVFGTRSRFPVRATFNRIEYRGSTMPNGDGTFCLGITKAIRAQAGADVGGTVHVVLERDDEERQVDVPAELVNALAAAGLDERFHAMAFTHRKEYAQWIAEAKKADTRARRVERAVAMIAAGQRR